MLPLQSDMSDLIREADDEDTTLLISLNRYLHMNADSLTKAVKKINRHQTIVDTFQVYSSTNASSAHHTDCCNQSQPKTVHFHSDDKQKPELFRCQNLGPLCLVIVPMFVEIVAAAAL